MKENEPLLDQVFKVWPAHGEDAYLEIAMNDEGMLVIKTKDEQSERYFGKVEFSLEPVTANKVADATKMLYNKTKETT